MWHQNNWKSVSILWELLTSTSSWGLTKSKQEVSPKYRWLKFSTKDLFFLYRKISSLTAIWKNWMLTFLREIWKFFLTPRKSWLMVNLFQSSLLGLTSKFELFGFLFNLYNFLRFSNKKLGIPSSKMGNFYFFIQYFYFHQICKSDKKKIDDRQSTSEVVALSSVSRLPCWIRPN